jgi:hypothetical protein
MAVRPEHNNWSPEPALGKSHPGDKDKDVARVGAPCGLRSGEKEQRQEQPRILRRARCAGLLRKTNLWGGLVVSHPSDKDKDKDVARVGHPGGGGIPCLQQRET